MQQRRFDQHSQQQQQLQQHDVQQQLHPLKQGSPRPLKQPPTTAPPPPPPFPLPASAADGELLRQVQREVDRAAALPEVQVDVGAVPEWLAREDQQSTLAAKLVESGA